jgi:hypothetical protein
MHNGILFVVVDSSLFIFESRMHWEVGYFGKPKLRPELRTDGMKKDLPENLRGNPSAQQCAQCRWARLDQVVYA